MGHLINFEDEEAPDSIEDAQETVWVWNSLFSVVQMFLYALRWRGEDHSLPTDIVLALIKDEGLKVTQTLNDLADIRYGYLAEVQAQQKNSTPQI